MEIEKILKISYDGLKPLEKELFLDIACFWRRENKVVAMKVLDACGFHPNVGVKVLRQKGLVTISVNNLNYQCFELHDLVQEMGRYVVTVEHPNNPEKYSRLWRNEDIEEMRPRNATTIKENDITEAIQCSNCPSSFGKLVSNSKKLRFLSQYNFDKRHIEGPDYLSNELFPRKLVVLELHNSLQEQLWRNYKLLPCLKELYLEKAHNLVRLPDFGGLPCLERLTVKNCPKIKRIEGNFHALQKLQKCVISSESHIFRGEPIRLPKDLFNEHIHLEELHLYETRQRCNFYLPRFIRSLTLSSCGMKDGEILCDIGVLSNLQELDLSYNEFSRLNFNLSQLTQLKLLDLTCCRKLVELPQLPTSVSILKADDCNSLEEVGDIINTDCKWVSQVAIKNVWRSVRGGERLLEIMLQGNATENGCMLLQLDGVEIPKGFTPPLLLIGNRYRLELAENWFNDFSGFLFCAATEGDSTFQEIRMKHDKGDDHDFAAAAAAADDDDDNDDDADPGFWEDDVCGEQGIDGVGETWVGYISFGLLKHTSWWDPTSTAIEFSLQAESDYVELVSSGFGVRLVSQTEKTITNSSIKSSNDLKCQFRSYLKEDRESRCKSILFFIMDV